MRRPWEGLVAGGGVDGEGQDLVGRGVRHFLDVHAAFGGGDEGDARGLTVDQKGEIELARYPCAILDVDAVDLLARGARLLGHERAPASMRFASFAASSTDFGAADAALFAGIGFRNLPLPRPPAWICAFTTQIGPSSAPAAVLASSALRTTRPSDTGAPVLTEERFRLVFVNVHSRSLLPVWRAIGTG